MLSEISEYAAAIETTAAPEGERRTVEAVCCNCGLPGDAVCPHCRHEYTADSLVPPDGKISATPEQLIARFAALARHIGEQRNARFWWACFLIATGQADADGVSMADLGRKWGVGRAAVSKICVEICARMGLPPSRSMRSEGSKKSFQLSNRRNRKP